MRTRFPLIVLVLIALVPKAQAQDPQLSQFYAAPMYLNPALTGNTYQDRIGLNYRLQWPGIAPGFETYAVSYDHNNAKAHSGYGFMVMHDEAGTNGLSFTHIGGSYSYEARINHENAIRFGMCQYFDSALSIPKRKCATAGSVGTHTFLVGGA